MHCQRICLPSTSVSDIVSSVSLGNRLVITLVSLGEMRLAVRLLRPAANQNIRNPKLWQDPVIGYFETHGEFFIPLSFLVSLFFAFLTLWLQVCSSH